MTEATADIRPAEPPAERSCTWEHRQDEPKKHSVYPQTLEDTTTDAESIHRLLQQSRQEIMTALSSLFNYDSQLLFVDSPLVKKYNNLI